MTTFTKMMERHLAKKNLSPRTEELYREYARKLDEALHKSVKDVSTEDILNLKHRLANRTGIANMMLRVASVACSAAIASGLRYDNPCAGVSKWPTRDHEAWTEEDVDRIGMMEGVGRRLCMLLAHTGQRVGDVLHLTWANLSPDLSRITVQQSKTGQEVSIPVAMELRNEMRHWHGGPYLVSGGMLAKERSCYQVALREIKRVGICKPPHGLRYYMITRLAEAGCTPHEIMSVSGHKTLRMVEKYSAAASREMLANRAMAKLNGERT